jgi:hypothetical protein
MTLFQRSLALWLAIFVGWAGIASPQEARIGLTAVRQSLLLKTSGRVCQVHALSVGQLAVRDFDLAKEAAQALEIYGLDGRLKKKIGRFGRGPGHYYRLRDIDVSTQGDLWAADVDMRLTRFSVQGAVRETRLVQRPGFPVHDLALDEARGVYFLAGCDGEKMESAAGCETLHRYDLKGNYQRSFLPLDLKTRPLSTAAFEVFSMDLDRSGRVFMVDGPLPVLWRIEPTTGAVLRFAVKSKVFVPPPAIPLAQITKEWLSKTVSTFSRLEQVEVVAPYVVVSIRKPTSEVTHLAVFDTAGRQLAVDLPAPGPLVGSTAAGNLLFARKTPKGFEILEQKIVRAGARK